MTRALSRATSQFLGVVRNPPLRDIEASQGRGVCIETLGHKVAGVSGWIMKEAVNWLLKMRKVGAGLLMMAAKFHLHRVHLLSTLVIRVSQIIPMEEVPTRHNVLQQVPTARRQTL